jgi:hypothetical protein
MTVDRPTEEEQSQDPMVADDLMDKRFSLTKKRDQDAVTKSKEEKPLVNVAKKKKKQKRKKGN